MSIRLEEDVEASTGPSDGGRRKRSWRDFAFFGIFAAYSGGAVYVLLGGIGAVIASLSDGFHDQLHEIGDFRTGFVARTALRMADASHELPSGLVVGLGYAFSAVNVALAIFLLWLRPRDRTARLLGVGLMGAAGAFNLTAQLMAEQLPMLQWESVAQGAAHVIGGLAFIFALVTFPDGRPVPRWPAPALAVLYAPVMFVAVFLALRAEGTARPATLLIFFGTVVPIVGVAAQAYRLLRSDSPSEHQQARLLFWSLLPSLGVGIWFVATQGLPVTGSGFEGRHLPELPVAVFSIFQPVFLLVPLALFAGLLRYRLWDIDRVINRTLVYGVLTATLGGAYLGIVVLLQRAFRPLTGGSDLAVAVSTLAMVVVFVPARRRVQDFVDRRFYRHRYDAARTIESFSARLRDQLDMESLTAELRTAVAETMQPATVSLLLREPEGGRMAWQWTFRPKR